MALQTAGIQCHGPAVAGLGLAHRAGLFEGDAQVEVGLGQPRCQAKSLAETRLGPSEVPGLQAQATFGEEHFYLAEVWAHLVACSSLTLHPAPAWKPYASRAAIER